MGEEKANQLQVAFLETSAMSGDNLDKGFQMMINEIYKKNHEDISGEGEDNPVEPGGKDISLTKNNTNPEKKKCC